MKLGIDPKIDFAFKRMCLANPVLKSIVQSVVDFEVMELEITNPFLDKVNSDGKMAILDIKAKDASGRLFNVEIQLSGGPDLLQRFLYYCARVYVSQLNEGEEYNTLSPTISICFVNGTVFRESNEYHTCIQLRDNHTHRIVSRDLELHIFELNKFRKHRNELNSPLDQWLYFLLYAEGFDPKCPPPELTVPEISRAIKELNDMSDSTLERELYEARFKAQKDALWQKKRLERLDQKEEELELREESLTHKEESLTHKEESLTHKEESLTHKEESLTHKEESLTHKEESLTHKEESLTHNAEEIARRIELLELEEEAFARERQELARQKEELKRGTNQ
jgi:predicted transposase/invertase (TIGR01784 family)